MAWLPEQTLADFATVARLAGVSLAADDIRIEALPAPHAPPTRLPAGQMAVYVFTHGRDVLKVGKVGPKSQARYTSQHYNPGSAQSTLAASMITDAERIGLGGLIGPRSGTGSGRTWIGSTYCSRPASAFRF